ncbi:hypothetical protein M878_36975 [Streptomyces roseochromogenus subsp. oscitans DS 12.976]|uniref:Uncharacterized protein n=1 Tax=Streptomyces roseochromogenus subsp. oscitans DS 12.976 TaxID=1352936 RepID=V6JX68_STRRC|nr:hypothetical protein M878_36975 [Streptomyces roseochromogenus subsp. oscitans DS 12.976]
MSDDHHEPLPQRLHHGDAVRDQVEHPVHLADAAEEGRVGADDQHGAAGQQLAVLVEEIGGAVQRDRRLPGTRPALDHQDPAVRHPDDASTAAGSEERPWPRTSTAAAR